MPFFRKILHKYDLLIIVYFLFFNTTAAQQIKFEHLNSENGLPVSSVTCITQDNQGFMWMGSINGLVKFDGYNYQLFQFNQADSSSIPGHLVTQIVSANNGLLYLSVIEQGLTILDTKTEKFKTLSPDFTDSVMDLTVKAMLKDSLGNLWLGTSNGLYYFNTKTQNFTNYALLKLKTASDSLDTYQNYISALAFDKDNNLYILGHKGLLTFFNTKTFESKHINYTNNLLRTLYVFNTGKLYITADEEVWIGTETDGIYIYNTKIEKTIKHIFPGSMISYIKQIGEYIWVGTDGHGLYVVNSEGTLIQQLANDPSNPYSLSSNSVFTIEQSRDQTIWVGNYATGVNLYNASRHKFLSITDLGLDDQRLVNKSVLCLNQLNDSLLLIGTDGGGVNLLNPKSLKTSKLKSSFLDYDKIVAKSICRISDNSFYMGTFGQGLFFCKLKENNFLEIKPIKRKSTSSLIHVWALLNASDTALWVGYLNSGLSIYNPISNSFIDLPFFDGKNILLIREINNEIWISAEQKGLFICNKEGELKRHYENNAGNPYSLSSNNIFDIFEDSKGHVWIGTSNGGLNRVADLNNGVFEVFNTKNGFPAHLINNIEEDAQGNLWMSSELGLISFNLKNKSYDIFDKKDGLQGKNFNYKSSFSYKNSALFFGGVDGLSIFNPEKISRNTIVPQIAFTSLFIHNKKIKKGDTINGHVIFDKAFSSLQKLNLSHKENDFRIEFSALHFESSINNHYKYKLEGFDNEWILCGPGQHSAHYTNLRKGNFIFKVQATNADNIWTKAPIELKIVIKPPFYETTWFYVIVILLLIYLVILIIRERTRYLEKEKEKLKVLINMRTEALRVKAQEVIKQNEEISIINKQLQEYNKTRDKIYSIIAHDLRGPLAAIISFSDILNTNYETQDKVLGKKYMGIIWQTANKMNRLITNLLYWVNNQSNKIILSPQHINLENVFNDVEDILEANALQKNIRMNFSHNQSIVYADSEMLVVIIRNLVSNSIKFTPKSGNISVTASMENNSTTILIIDDGVGISDEQLRKLEKREMLISTAGTNNEIGTGLGLFLCKDLTEKNGGKFNIVSSAGKGTQVQLTLPSKPNNQ